MKFAYLAPLAAIALSLNAFSTERPGTLQFLSANDDSMKDVRSIVSMNGIALLSFGNLEFQSPTWQAIESNLSEHATDLKREGHGSLGAKSVNELAHHLVQCDRSAGINQFQLTRSSIPNGRFDAMKNAEADPAIRYSYTCGGGLGENPRLDRTHTPFNADGMGNTIYLDRHNVACKETEAIQSFQLQNGKKTHYGVMAFGKKYTVGMTGAPYWVSSFLEQDPENRFISYAYSCVEARIGELRTYETTPQDEGNGLNSYLERHNVECPKDTLLNSFLLVRVDGGKYKYVYKCGTPGRKLGAGNEHELDNLKGRFVDNKDGSVTDKETGLAWEKDAQEKSYSIFSGASSYCTEKGNKWRLPTVLEQQSLLITQSGNKKRRLKTLNPIFGDSKGAFLSSVIPSSLSRQYPVYMGTYFTDGTSEPSHGHQSQWVAHRVRCVRD